MVFCDKRSYFEVTKTQRDMTLTDIITKTENFLEANTSLAEFETEQDQKLLTEFVATNLYNEHNQPNGYKSGDLDQDCEDLIENTLYVLEQVLDGNRNYLTANEEMAIEQITTRWFDEN